MWLAILSDQLEIAGLVGLYPTNYLIPLGLIPWHAALRSRTFILRYYAVLATVSRSYPLHKPDSQALLHPSATRQQESKLSPATVRLACVKPAASVQSEP